MNQTMDVHTSTYFELAEPIMNAKLTSKPANVMSKDIMSNFKTESPTRIAAIKNTPFTIFPSTEHVI